MLFTRRCILMSIHLVATYIIHGRAIESQEHQKNDESLQALGRKISSFNGYKLWAGDQPDFVYEGE